MEALRALRELLPALQRFIFLVAEVFSNSESLISVFVSGFGLDLEMEMEMKNVGGNFWERGEEGFGRLGKTPFPRNLMGLGLGPVRAGRMAQPR